MQLRAIKRRAGEKPPHLQAVRDSLKVEYEEFDDFIEMAIQFGYVTLFAAAMPAAAAIACAYTFIETRSDLIKLLFLNRRPVATRTTSIGVWANVIKVRNMPLHACMVVLGTLVTPPPMQVQAWLSIATNSVLFAFSSDQVAEFVPQLFRTLHPVLPVPGDEPDKVRAHTHAPHACIHACGADMRRGAGAHRGLGTVASGGVGAGGAWACAGGTAVGGCDSRPARGGGGGARAQVLARRTQGTRAEAPRTRAPGRPPPQCVGSARHCPHLSTRDSV
jgi:Calcium-activated chloride channel